jgi:hypothetical protein
MMDQLKRMIFGTSLELPFRKLYAAFNALRSNEEDQNLLYDIQTLEVMKRVLRKDSNCVDVGCHHGSILKMQMHFAPKGAHFAFE